MKSIHIRDVDPLVIMNLQKRAKMHHRSMQGELRAILQEAADRVPEVEECDPEQLITVNTGSQGTWRREDMYSDQAR